MNPLSILALRLKNSGIRLSLVTLLSLTYANAVEVSVTGAKNWIWFGNDDTPKQTENGTNTEVKEQDGKVSLTGPVHYYKPPSTYIDKISVDGSNAMAVLQTNQAFDIGMLTLKGGTSLVVAGAYVQENCQENCAVFRAQNLLLDTTTGKEMYVKFIDAQKTTITGDGTINFNKATNLANNVHLGDVVVKEGASATIKTDDAAVEANMNSLKVEKGASLNLGNKDADDLKGKVNINAIEVAGTLDISNASATTLKVNTLDVKAGATLPTTQGKLSAENIIAEAGAKNLDKVLNDQTSLTITAKKSGTVDEFFSTQATSTNLGMTPPASFKEGVSIKKNVVDDGFTKKSADFVTVVAKDAQGNFIANSANFNISEKPSNRLQASLDNAYLAHNVLLANTMALNSKMLLFKNYKNSDEIASEYELASRHGYVRTYGDFWLDYDFATLNKYGENLSGTNHSVQVGAGIFQTNSIRAGAFFRYTGINAQNKDNDNSYTGSAYNAGFYAVANLWMGGYLRGQLGFTGLNLKGDYSLQNDFTGETSSKSLKDNFNYITTGVGVSQEGVLPSNLRGSVAFDLNHIVPLSEKYEVKEFDERLDKNSITLLSVSAMLGMKINPNLMVFTQGQIAYALSSKDDENTLQDFAYSYNMLVTNAGVGVAYDITEALKVSADVGVGFYSETKTNLRANLGVNYLF